MKKILQTCILLILTLLFSCTSKSVQIIDEINAPSTHFAVNDLKNVLTESGYNHSDNSGEIIQILISKDLKAQEYIIKPEADKIIIEAGDANGGMYGLLDVTEQIKLKGSLKEITSKHESPFIEYRGIKMNIALDGRLPSYDDTGDAAQKNIAEMWNMDFWVEYLDDLARHRYNMLTLWSKHPFPAMCKLIDFPGAAMEDVYVYNKPITWDMERDWEEIDLQDKNNLRKIKSMTIDEKIAFWQKVMEHAHNRGIDVVWFTWNIFISPGTGKKMKPESEEALVYMRKAVQEMAENYPYLSGIGVTAGERMDRTVGPYSAAEWMFETYGKGVIEAKKNNPDRPFRFIFRRHHCTLPEIQNDFAAHFPGKVETSYKYSVAHMYSSVNPPLFEQEYLPDVKKYGVDCWMNLRNDDVFAFRWGDPDYVRDYLKGMMSYGVTPGFYMGSDGYLWGREFTSKDETLSGELEIKKHWYRYMLWGRLAFNPDLSNKYLQEILSSHFPGVDAKNLLQAWQAASKVFPIVTSFHWKPADAMWSVEGCMDQYNGFQTLRDLVDCYTLEPDNMLNITDYVDLLKTGGSSTAKNPLQIADSLRLCSAETFKYLTEIKNNKNITSEFQATIKDIECMALYGEYYASKILAATYLHMHERISGDEKESYKEIAIKEASNAAAAWEKLAKIADSQYKPQLLARTRELDWIKTQQFVNDDIEIVKSSTGEVPKIVRIFRTGYTKVDDSQLEKLDKYLISKGFTIEKLAGWKVESYATGLKLVISNKQDLIAQFYTSRGGTYPENFEKVGFIINEISHKLWLVGNTNQDCNKGIDMLIEKLEKEIL